MMKVFITGATGYIGGSIAEALLASGYTVSGLARNKEKAEYLLSRNIAPVLGELDDSEILAGAAKDADVIINAANSDHRGVVETLLKAIVGSGKTFIQNSGSSIVADDAYGEPGEKIFDEETTFEPLPQKVARVDVDKIVRSAAKDNIRSIVICPTMIYGRGTGLHKSSSQIPSLIEQAKKDDVARYFGRGLNRWSNVHISDLVGLYLLAIESAKAGDFFYVENGEENIKNIAEEIGRLLEFGSPAESWSRENAEKEWSKGAVFALASNSRVRAVKARGELNWQPKINKVLVSIAEEI
jgi:nucleoside-diphosphate-sugar epimerase